MIEPSVPKDHGRENPEFSPCFRHEGEGCPRCDGSGYRPRRVCDVCGESAKNLTPERTAKSWQKANALPRSSPKRTALQPRDVDASGAARRGGEG